MNLSGESVKPLASYYKIPPERVLAIYDDLDLEFAVMKLLSKGGHGGHNGMRSIGWPPGQMDTQAYVLQKFSANEREELDFALDRGVDAIRMVTKEGLDKAVSTWNQVRKSKITKMKYSTVNID
ncbi:hypothetical protein R1flu_015605 [Riccia fluitans]|uniref:peptidyl-tRNA hydrolase n=1 Tax=Riccia fluitans TaxID=41844 RepID=A0ABD1YJF4_9MARC